MRILGGKLGVMKILRLKLLFLENLQEFERKIMRKALIWILEGIFYGEKFKNLIKIFFNVFQQKKNLNDYFNFKFLNPNF